MKEATCTSVTATTTGHHQSLRCAREQFGPVLRWAIEDCRHLYARLERDLLTAGQSQAVVRVPPKIMPEQRRMQCRIQRRIARTRGNSDPIDALAVARTAQREPDLPARHAGIAPNPVWLGNTAGRVRLTRSGNRHLTLRCLTRRLARVVDNHLTADQVPVAASFTTAA